ncbi:hypothetical protein MAC_00283 [Metarhizium acridum CQMa 102]|uniref:Uncharacterized protein n=1 Tax=Metarhizium acridum (strain CQMa 102) TaxID=655827 RepID=E9DRB4_METAQ|nr:uncharacterized protein MAC_00283 [Metarhizium acridum CQMa 102]EFY93792.1 hypothetical protein MAC_00283 [Metarhizium acridum CQMa 102]
MPRPPQDAADPPSRPDQGMTNPPKDYCSISVPASLSKDWSSYTSSASSWLKAHSSDLAKCPGAGQVTSKSPIDCKAGSGSGVDNPTKTGAASRETGVALAAVAAAGLALAAL